MDILYAIVDHLSLEIQIIPIIVTLLFIFLREWC